MHEIQVGNVLCEIRPVGNQKWREKTLLGYILSLMDGAKGKESTKHLLHMLCATMDIEGSLKATN